MNSSVVSIIRVTFIRCQEKKFRVPLDQSLFTSVAFAAEDSDPNMLDGNAFALSPEKTQECDRQQLKVPGIDQVLPELGKKPAKGFEFSNVFSCT